MELDKTSEARRKAQRNGEEDPVVVAQRFLNIYRQLHIFNPEKKEAFNHMLLELSPQIRGLFGQLPGGAMLQDYVDELAEKKGVEKSAAAGSSADIADDDVKQAKILATALAEAQVQATAKMQEMGAAPLASTLNVAPTAVTTAKLAMDKNFAQEFSTMLASAMQQNSVNQENEIKNIINTLGRTQLEIIKVLQTENTEHREEMKKISQIMLQAQGQAGNDKPQDKLTIGAETKQLIRILLEGQKQLLERITRVENKPVAENNVIAQDKLAELMTRSERNFGLMIKAFNERQKNDTLEIAKLINESQQNLVQMMVQNNTLNQNSGNTTAANNNANNIQINTADYSGVLNKIAERLGNLQASTMNGASPAANIQVSFPEQALSKIIKMQSQIYQDIARQQTKELSEMITLALKESQKSSTQSLIAALKANPAAINYTTAPIAEAEPDETALHHIPQFSEDFVLPQAEDGENAQNDSIDLFDDELPTTEERPVVGDVVTADDSSNISAETAVDEAEKPKKKKKKKKKKKTAEEPATIDELLGSDDNNDVMPALQMEAANFTDDILADIISAPEPLAEPEPEPEPEPESGSEPAEEDKTAEEAPAVETAPTNIWQDDELNELQNDLEEADKFVSTADIDTANDWGFSTTPDKTEEPQATEAAAEDNNGDWEWVYEEEPSSAVTDTTDSAGEGTDWEWEYVPENEAPDNISFHQNNLVPLSDKSPICSGELFFQEQAYNPLPLVNGSTVLVAGYTPQILDSANVDQGADPYQNSALKD